MQNHASDSGAPATLGQPRPVVNSSTRSEPTYIEIDDVSNPRGIYVTTISGQKPNQAISVGNSELPPPNTADSPYTSLQDRKIDVYTKPTTKGMHSGQKPNQVISVGYSELPPPNTADSPYTSLQDRKIDVYTKPTTKGMHSGQKPNQVISVGYSELPPPNTADSPYTSLQDRRIDEYTKPTNKGMHSTDD
ncbi:uncharacterized protein [Ptychodera flava]|uniref:uncharacterized protein n=1 Tax=Ptychodera flava TaxID=63121 RepID=UPI00396A1F0F